MRILVTGAAGGLGRAFVNGVPSHHDVVALSHEELDVGDHHSVTAAVAAIGPDLIVNAAAFTAVDTNEADPARAFRDNAQGPQSLALAARRAGAVLLHISTDYVFDGEKGAPYDETDRPRPLSVYGRSKLAGERFVREALPEHVIVRTGYVFGGGGDFLSRQVARLAAGEEVSGLEDRTGSPTYVVDLAERLIPLVLSGRPGTYHLAGPEPVSWFEVLQRCARIGSFHGPVSPQRAVDLDLAAPRPRDSGLVSVFVENLSIPALPPLDDALARMLAR